MNKIALSLALAVSIGLSLTAFAADDHANKNGSDAAKPTSSTAATPADKDHSPGTVGAMKDAGGGSFTATKKDADKADLKGH